MLLRDGFLWCKGFIWIDPNQCHVAASDSDLFDPLFGYPATSRYIETAPNFQYAHLEFLLRAHLQDGLCPIVPSNLLGFVVLPSKVAKHKNCRTCPIIAIMTFRPVATRLLSPAVVLDAFWHELERIRSIAQSLGLPNVCHIFIIIYITVVTCSRNRFVCFFRVLCHRTVILLGGSHGCWVHQKWFLFQGSSPNARILAILVGTLPQFNISVAIMNLFR
mmetsp:Transcript_11565/g.16184  ORF Transcript_11565/g.16184 Transcript_11565/m.16184 type:complete len:219 (+) Transcript_11565:120-776(+)